jgi:hypothetical protein
MNSNDTNILQTAIWTLLFVVPGYIAAEAKHYWMMTTPRRPTDKTIESLWWSFIVYFLISWLPSTVFDLNAFSDLISSFKSPEKVLFNSWFLQSYIFILSLAAVVGFSYGHFFPTNFMSVCFGRTPHARVWDEFFKMRSYAAANHGVWIELKDGTQWIGKLNSASDTPGSSELWLRDVRRYFPEDQFISDTPYVDMLVNADNIARIFIVKEGVLCTYTAPPPRNTVERIYRWFQYQRKHGDKSDNKSGSDARDA